MTGAGCVLLSTVLGPDADIEDQEAVVSALIPFAVGTEVTSMEEPTGP